MRRPRHLRSWKDAAAWASMHQLKGADVVIRLNSKSYFLDDAIPEFGGSYDHIPWRAVNDAYHKPSNVAWQLFRESPVTGGRGVWSLFLWRRAPLPKEKSYSEITLTSAIAPACQYLWTSLVSWVQVMNPGCIRHWIRWRLNALKCLMIFCRRGSLILSQRQPL